jgi:hypothetical protein
MRFLTETEVEARRLELLAVVVRQREARPDVLLPDRLAQPLRRIYADFAHDVRVATVGDPVRIGSPRV